MNYYENFNEMFIGRVVFPFTNYLFNRKKIIKNYKNLIDSQWYNCDLLHELQLTKLKKLIKYAYDWIPYYTSKFNEIGLNPLDINELEDIQSIPPISRQELIENHNEMVDKRFQSSIKTAERSTRGAGIPIPFAIFRKHKLVKNTSSGSTGAPTTFYEDGSMTALNWAHEFRYRSWYNINPGAREVRLTRLSTDYQPHSKQALMRKICWNQLILPGVNLSDEDYALCLYKIKKFKPKVIWGFTAALTGLADYIKKNNDKVLSYRPSLLIGWAAPLYEHEERILRDVFECSVSNIYGSREVGHIAALCPNGSLHINQENLFVENEAIEGHDSGQGEILVTNLHITPMPFIRYRMGDLGEISDSKCECGRSLQVLNNFLGRTGEVFITKDGHMISPNFWCRTFMDYKMSESVKRFQIIYKSNIHFVIKLVRNKNYTSETEKHLRYLLKKNFQSDMKIDFDYVSEIKPEISGKYQMVIKEFKS